MQSPDMKKKELLYFLVPLALAVLLLASALLCKGGINRRAGLLPTQAAAERWQGEGEMPFAMISCFMSESAGVDYNEIIRFRYEMLKAENGAGLQANETKTIFRDAWSVKGEVNVKSTGKSAFTTNVIAVGGNFFDIHPLKLLSGCYFYETDLMQDRVILDRTTAWRLFGGTELQNMTIEIEGKPFQVCGVVDLEDDDFTKAATGEDSLIFMSLSALQELKEVSGITCYEILSPEPVEGFAMETVKTNFKMAGTVLRNTGRFEKANLKELRKNRTSRAMVSGGLDLPYWENAARSCEDSILRLSSASGVLFGLFAVSLLAAAGGFLLYRKRKKE